MCDRLSRPTRFPAAGPKECGKCGTNKRASEFSQFEDSADGLFPWCKDCFGAANTSGRISKKLLYKMINLWAITPEKKCNECEEVKPTSQFSLYPNSKDGFTYKCKVCLAESARNSIAAMSDEEYRKKRRATRMNKLLRVYKMTIEQYDSILKSQGGVCAICGTSDPGKNAWGTTSEFHVDHDHLSGEIRGLLCIKCNVGLGKFSDDVYMLDKAIDYLNSPPTRSLRIA